MKDIVLLKQEKQPELDMTGFLFTRGRMSNRKPVISDSGTFLCFNCNVSNLYKNSVVGKKCIILHPTTIIYHKSSVSFKMFSFGRDSTVDARYLGTFLLKYIEEN